MSTYVKKVGRRDGKPITLTLTLQWAEALLLAEHSGQQWPRPHNDDRHTSRPTSPDLAEVPIPANKARSGLWKSIHALSMFLNRLTRRNTLFAKTNFVAIRMTSTVAGESLVASTREAKCSNPIGQTLRSACSWPGRLNHTCTTHPD
jgi:hypothetical protein